MNTILQELNNWRRVIGLRYADISEKTGISVQSLSNMFNGTKPISKKSSEAFMVAYGMNPNFLLYGKGPLFIDCSEDATGDTIQESQVVHHSSHPDPELLRLHEIIKQQNEIIAQLIGKINSNEMA